LDRLRNPTDSTEARTTRYSSTPSKENNVATLSIIRNQKKKKVVQKMEFGTALGLIQQRDAFVWKWEKASVRCEVSGREVGFC
jgi:hypothetical protein